MGKLQSSQAVSVYFCQTSRLQTMAFLLSPFTKPRLQSGTSEDTSWPGLEGHPPSRVTSEPGGALLGQHSSRSRAFLSCKRSSSITSQQSKADAWNIPSLLQQLEAHGIRGLFHSLWSNLLLTAVLPQWWAEAQGGAVSTPTLPSPLAQHLI